MRLGGLGDWRTGERELERLSGFGNFVVNSIANFVEAWEESDDQV